MQIDLFTFFAQIINFLSLVVLLYFFLYKRIIKAIDFREKTIKEEFEKAEENSLKAEIEKQYYQDLISEIEENKKEIFAQISEEAEEKKQRMIEQAREEAEKKRSQWEKQIGNQKKQFLGALQKKIGKEIFEVAEVVLESISNIELQEQVVKKFLDMLEKMELEHKSQLHDAYQDRKKEEVEILSSRRIQEEQKKQMEESLSEIFKEKPKIVFEINPELSLGLALKIDGFILNWTPQNYFEELEQKFNEALKFNE